MSEITIKPLADRVVVLPAAAETQTASGIIIPDTAKEKPQPTRKPTNGNVSRMGRVGTVATTKIQALHVQGKADAVCA